MIQKNGVLTPEDNRISLVSEGRTTRQEDCLAIAERELPVNTIEQTWIFETGDKARAGRTTPTLVNALVKAVGWVNHLGSRKVADGLLESRHNIHHNFRINGIGR